MVPGLGASAGRLFTGAGISAVGNAKLPRARPIVNAARAKVTEDLSVGNEWQIADFFRNDEQEPSVVFTEEALNETTTELLGPAYRVEEPDDGQDANAVMQAAKAQMYHNPILDYMPVLHSLVRDPEIQRVAMTRLRRNPDFQRLMLANSAAQPVQAAPLAIDFPDNSSPAEEAEGGIKSLIEDLASKLKAAGEAAVHTAAGLRLALGRLLINLGANLHAFLGQPFSRTPLEETASGECMDDEKAEIVGQALITVAVAILSIVFLKRAHLAM